MDSISLTRIVRTLPSTKSTQQPTIDRQQGPKAWLHLVIATVLLNGSGSTLTLFLEGTGSFETVLDWNRFPRFGSLPETVRTAVAKPLRGLT